MRVNMTTYIINKRAGVGKVVQPMKYLSQKPAEVNPQMPHKNKRSEPTLRSCLLTSTCLAVYTTTDKLIGSSSW